MQSFYSLRSSSKPPRPEPFSRPTADRPRSGHPPPRPSLPALASPLPAFKVPLHTPPQPILPKPVADPLDENARAHLSPTSAQHYSSSGSHHDPSSVCLAAMVHEFLEEEARVGSCGRARCNCSDGACSGEGGCDPGETDESWPGAGEQLCEILEGVTSCTSTTELLLLADVANAVEAETEETSNSLDNEGPNNATIGGLRRSVMKRLRQAGHDAALCKSRWNHANGLPAGDYEYIDVLLAKNDGKNDRYIVDTDFKAQFEIARASKQYFELLNVLPRIFVGRPERLKQILKIMSGAAKRSLKKQGLLLPPWRKLRYLQAKWFSSYKRTTNEKAGNLPSSEESLRFLALKSPRFCSEFTKEMDMLYFRAQSQLSKLDPVITKRDEFCEESQIKVVAEKNREEDFVNVKQKNERRIEKRNICRVICPEWQLPAINSKTERQSRRVSGLANALKEAGICTPSTFQKPLGDLANQQIVGVLS